MRQSMTCIVMILAVLTLGFGEPKRLEAQTIIVGHDYGGSDLLPANNAVLSGVFTNVGTFRIAAGTTVFVNLGVPLSIAADLIEIDGILDGSGAGNLGGNGVPNILLPSPCSIPNNTESGLPGEGLGGGGGGLFGCAIDGSGGGGGGYGGAGGRSGSDGDTAPALGGAMVGNASTASIEMGAGGGSGSLYDASPPGSSGAGGDGGSAILLRGPLALTGSIIVNGTPGLSGFQLPLTNIGTSAGGGGSGGGVLLDSGPNGASSLNGSISAAGGAGGDGGPKEFGSGGGGGSGGRIKLFGTAVLGANFSYDISGGSEGLSAPSRTSSATAGDDGTFFNATTLPSVDDDGDGVDDDDDRCPDTVIPESVPTVRLGVNRFVLADRDDGSFATTSPNGKGPRKVFTVQATAGCSCEQIIAILGLGQGHTKFGCSISAMETWINRLN